MVVQANAVANPGAMVIHPHHAGIADRTMMGPWWPDHIAFEAVPPPNKAQDPIGKMLINFLFNVVPFLISHVINFLLQKRHVFKV